MRERGRGFDRHVHRAAMALSEMVNRLSVLEGPNEGDASLALGHAGVADARDCGSAITLPLPYFESYRNAAQPDLFSLFCLAYRD